LTLESSGGVLSTVDMVVQRRDGPRRLRDHDDDDDDMVTKTPLGVEAVYGCEQLAQGPAFS